MQTLCIFLALMGLNKQEECNEKKCVHGNDLSSWQLNVEMACLGIKKFEEEPWLGHRQLRLKNGSNCRTQFLVHITAKATNRYQLTISCWLLSSSKCNWYWALQHNHHILHNHTHKIVNRHIQWAKYGIDQCILWANCGINQCKYATSF